MEKLIAVEIKSKLFGTPVSAPVPIPGAGPQFLTQITDVGKLVSTFLSNALIVAGLILLIYIIVAGIGMIGSAGSDNPESMEKGKKAVTSALIGFIIVFCAYWIVQLISKLTGLEI